MILNQKILKALMIKRFWNFFYDFFFKCFIYWKKKFQNFLIVKLFHYLI